jgi:hypothetical protein
MVIARHQVCVTDPTICGAAAVVCIIAPMKFERVLTFAIKKGIGEAVGC